MLGLFQCVAGACIFWLFYILRRRRFGSPYLQWPEVPTLAGTKRAIRAVPRLVSGAALGGASVVVVVGAMMAVLFGGFWALHAIVGLIVWLWGATG